MLGLRLPINAARPIQALASDLDIPWRLGGRLGIAVLTVGLLGQLRQERAEPIAEQQWAGVGRDP